MPADNSDLEPVVDTDVAAWTAVKADLKETFGYTDAEAAETARAILNRDTTWRDGGSGEMRVRLDGRGAVPATPTNLKRLAAELHRTASVAEAVNRKLAAGFRSSI